MTPRERRYHAMQRFLRLERRLWQAKLETALFRGSIAADKLSASPSWISIKDISDALKGFSDPQPPKYCVGLDQYNIMTGWRGVGKTLASRVFLHGK